MKKYFLYDEVAKKLSQLEITEWFLNKNVNVIIRGDGESRGDEMINCEVYYHPSVEWKIAKPVGKFEAFIEDLDQLMSSPERTDLNNLINKQISEFKLREIKLEKDRKISELRKIFPLAEI